VHLKTSVPLSGILIDTDSENVCLQGESIGIIFVIPRDNINYYSTDSIPLDPKVVKKEQDFRKLMGIDVFINNEFLVHIPTHPTIDLTKWNDDIACMVSENPDVQMALTGKIQKSVEYSNGILNISVDNIEQPETSNNIQNSFEMGGSNSPISTFLNPSQMVNRLQNMGKQNVKKTDMHTMQEANNGNYKNNNIPKNEQK
jgi:hypothetical protein